MGEVALGAIGLIPLYSFAHELFEDVQFARNCCADFDRYQTKLDLVDAKFTRWASSVGLDQTSASQPEITRISELVAENDGEHHTVKGTLVQIIRIFEKCKKKAKPYKATDQPPCDPNTDLGPAFKVTHRVLNRISRRRAPQFLPEQTERELGPWKRAKWALHDRDRIGSLISDLGDLVNELVQLFPASDAQRYPALAQEEVQDLHSSLSNASIEEVESHQALESISEIALENDEVFARLLENVVSQGKIGYRLRDHVHGEKATTVYGEVVNDSAVGKAKLDGGKVYDSTRGQHQGESFTIYGNMHGTR